MNDATLARKRPVFINLLKIRQPVAAVMSIGHRASGFLLFLVLPISAWLLDRALHSRAGFEYVRAVFHSWPGRIALFIVLWSLLHHLFAGIRYLLLDVHVGIERIAARRSAWAVMILGLLCSAGIMAVLW
ncbi:MAG: succinate dehydrogenase, cytochrome b556 subunit [Chromatiales bacterium]|nr:succinate dehydrogenase, cytochrome b556 subunit [Chromatiales bacterium]